VTNLSLAPATDVLGKSLVADLVKCLVSDDNFGATQITRVLNLVARLP
jgi:hypothetical protein